MPPRSRLGGPLRSSALAAYAIFVAAAWLIPFRYGLDYPRWDDWMLAPLFERVADGSANFSDFFRQFNEHRMLFPRAAFVALAELTGWSLKAAMYASILLSAAIFAMLLSMTSGPGQSAHHQRLTWLANVMSCALVFSAMQQGNWLFAIDMSWYLANAFVVGAIAVAYRANGRLVLPVLAASATLCVAASFSLASGVLAWVALLPLVFLVPRSQLERAAVLLSWLAAAAAVMYFYFRGLKTPTLDTGLTLLLDHPLHVLTVYLTALGFPLSSSTVLAPLAGAAALAIYAVAAAVFVRSFGSPTSRAIAPWLCLGIFAVLFAATVTVGRIGLSDSFATHYRFVSTSLLGSVAAIQLVRLYLTRPSTAAGHQFGPQEQRAWMVYVLAGMLLFSIIARSLEWTGHARDLYLEHRAHAVCLELLHYAPNVCLREVHPSPEILRREAAMIEHAGLRHFPRDLDLVTDTDPPYGYIDSTNADTVLLFRSAQSSTSFKLRGWAVARVQKRPANVVFFSRDSEKRFFAYAPVGLDRPDVAEIFGSRRYRDSGWEAEISAARLPPGESTIHAWAYDRSGHRLVRLAGSVRVLVVE
jgi:hypothetical protein